MPNIGPLEIAVVLVIVLLVFGPKRLPDLGRSLGSGLRQFKDAIGGEKDDAGVSADDRAARRRQVQEDSEEHSSEAGDDSSSDARKESETPASTAT